MAARKPRSAKQIAAQKKAAKASAAKRSKAASKTTPMVSRDAPGSGNKPVKIAHTRVGNGTNPFVGNRSAAFPKFFGRVNNNGKVAKREGLNDIMLVTRRGNRSRAVRRGEALNTFKFGG